MYLSRIELRYQDLPFSMLTKLDECKEYALHQWLWQLFPGQKQRHFLFRQEQITPNLRCYYLLSAVQPAVHNLLRVSSKPFAPQLTSGDQLFFSLRANPVITRKGKRADVLMDAKYHTDENSAADEIWRRQQQAATDWLIRQGESCGFALNPEQAVVTNYQQHRLKKPKTDKPIRFSSVDLQGGLRVTDPATFIAALTHGFGKCKAMGCGLMMLRRR